MYKYSDHARKRMASRGISEEDVASAVVKGELEFTKIDEKRPGDGIHAFHRTKGSILEENNGWMDI